MSAPSKHRCAVASAVLLFLLLILGALVAALLFVRPDLLGGGDEAGESLAFGGPADEEADLPPCPGPADWLPKSTCPNVDLLQSAGYPPDLPSERDVAGLGHFYGLKPLRYNLTFSQLDKQRFQSRVELVLKARQATSTVAFHMDTRALKADLRKAQVFSLCGEEVHCVVKVEAWEAAEVVLVRLARELPKDAVVRLRIPTATGMRMAELSTGGSEGSRGLYLANQMMPSYATGTIFQMRLARTLFPCVDVPSLKAKFLLHYYHPSETAAASVMPAEGEAERRGNLLLTRFRKSPRLSTYVFTFSAMHRMELYEEAHRGTLLQLFVPQGNPLTEVGWILNETKLSMDAMAELTGRPYFLPKLGLLNVYVSPFWGIENAGLITLDWQWTGYEAHETAHQILVHEVVHQWLGNLFTVGAWEDICLQEGLTAFLTARLGHELGFLPTPLRVKLSDLRRSGLAQDDAASAPVRRPYNVTQDIADVCFGKPPLAFAMLEDGFGPGLVQRLLRLLSQRFAFANAGLEDWAAVVSEAAGDKAAGRLLQTFLTQSHYPVLRVSRPSPATLLFRRQDPASSHVVPLLYSTPLKWEPTLGGLMEGPSVEVALAEADAPWYLVDPDMRTFARFVYPPENYGALLSCFASDIGGERRSDCRLSVHQLAAVFDDFCHALRHNALEDDEGGQENWTEILLRLRNLTDASRRGQGRLRLERRCACCLRRRHGLPAPGDSFTRTQCNQRSWDRHCSSITLLQGLL